MHGWIVGLLSDTSGVLRRPVDLLDTIEAVLHRRDNVLGEPGDLLALMCEAARHGRLPCLLCSSACCGCVVAMLDTIVCLQHAIAEAHHAIDDALDMIVCVLDATAGVRHPVAGPHLVTGAAPMVVVLPDRVIA